MTSKPRVIGCIIASNPARGFAFVRPHVPSGAADCFLHVSDTVSRVLPGVDDWVSFTITMGPRGPRAIEVQLVERPAGYRSLATHSFAGGDEVAR